MACNKRIVAVTGASGYLAGEIIHQLLSKGYHVRGTVRSLLDPVKTQHLKETFAGIELFEADLMKPGSFDECFKGAYAVMHTASPFLKTWKDPQVEMIEPALQGTKNVLSSVEKNLSTIKFVVVTSSAAAVVAQDAHLAGPAKVWDESDWNTTSTLTEGPYRFSKYLAEKAAWDWAEGKPVKLLSVCPTFILGPPHSKRTDATSIVTVIDLLNGKTKKTGTQAACFGAVDIRDAAKVHIACIENEKASGRYLVSSPVGISHLELVSYLKEKYGDKYPFPDRQAGETPYTPKYSSAKVKRDFGIEISPIKTAVQEMADALIKFGLIEIQEN